MKKLEKDLKLEKKEEEKKPGDNHYHLGYFLFDRYQYKQKNKRERKRRERERKRKKNMIHNTLRCVNDIRRKHKDR